MRHRRLSPLVVTGALIAAAAAAACGPVAVAVAADASASTDAPVSGEAPLSGDEVASADALHPGDTRGPQPTRVAEAETARTRSSGNDTVSRATRAASVGGEGGKTSELQSYLQWRAQRLPGRSCDPDGPVYVVLEPASPMIRDVPSDRTELLIHFTHSGAPDEIRIERSTGDDDTDAQLSEAVCAGVRASVAAPEPSDGSWARLTVRLGDPPRSSSAR
ncbi:MAG: hypothetical protein ACREUT_04145 [Steroidobacteraceae bacterium]